MVFYIYPLLKKKKKAELLEVNRLAVFTLLILCPVPNLFLTSFFLLQLLQSVSSDKTVWILSVLQHLDVRRAEEGLWTVFLSLSCMCFPITMLQQRDVAFSGISWHIYNKNQFGGYSCILRTAGRVQLMFTRVTFVVSKSRVSIWRVVCWKQYLPHQIPAAGLGMVGKSPVWLHHAQEHTDSKALQAAMGSGLSPSPAWDYSLASTCLSSPAS